MSSKLSTNIYHGIILDLEFKDHNFPNKFKAFAKRKSNDNDWVLFGVEIDGSKLQETIKEIQDNMVEDEPYYAHFYNDQELIVIFKEKVFKVKPHISSWEEIVEYGRKLNIPEEQLDFWPNRFQDEGHYFEKK